MFNKLLLFTVLAALAPSLCAQSEHEPKQATNTVPVAKAQSPAPAPDPLEAAWNVSISGNYANVSNAPTNNGVLTSVAFRIAQHWNLRADTYLLNSPAGMVLVLGGPEYRISAAHIFPQSNFMINANRMELFANIEAGDARTGVPMVVPQTGNIVNVSASKFAFSVGGGLDITISPMVTVRPLDVKYVRSSFLNNGGGFYGNQLDFAAGLSLRF